METYGVGDLASGGIDVGEYAASKRQKSLTGVGEGDVARARCSNAVPRSVSRLRICWDSEGCAM